jgi:hypothetical protein
VQLDFAARVKECFANTTGNFQALYVPGQYDGQSCPDVTLWYLKPLYVCAPNVWEKMKCPHCQMTFKKSGWLESISRVHDINGCSYLMQKKYLCSVLPTKVEIARRVGVRLKQFSVASMFLSLY